MARLRDRDPTVRVVDGRRSMDAVTAELFKLVWSAMATFRGLDPDRRR